jgi:hypothetical protein
MKAFFKNAFMFSAKAHWWQEESMVAGLLPPPICYHTTGYGGGDRSVGTLAKIIGEAEKRGERCRCFIQYFLILQ